MKARAIVFPEPNQVELDEIAVPEPAAGEVLTRTLYTGISTGTETRVLAGKEPGTEFPLIPGYENVGEVVAVGSGVEIEEGTKLFVGSSSYTGDYKRWWGGQVAYALAKAGDVVRIPPEVDPLDALFARVGAIALHGVKRGRIMSDDNVVIVGQGLIGHLAAQAALVRGARVIAVDRLPQRLEASRRAGVDETIDASTEDMAARVAELTDGGADVVVEATGVAAIVDGIARLVRPKPWTPPYPPSGRVVLLASYSGSVSFDYHPTLFDNEPDIYPSRYYTPEDIQEMMVLIGEGSVDPGHIPTEVRSTEDAPEAYRDVLDQKVMRIVFDWR